MTVRLSPLETLRALIALTRLAAATRFRLWGKYWSWRDETAFGKSGSHLTPTSTITRRARWHSILEYGLWVSRMRHLTR
ncbi:MAG: hypothetical protein EXS15_07565 [Phycisphaerales bacterium]|nr:hypothetical protein [Phycisphaerales bacterium]